MVREVKGASRIRYSGEDMANHTAFSLRLREAIAAKGMTQEALARELGLSLRAVQQWCLGQSEPRGRQLVTLSEILDRDPAWFFDGPPIEERAA